MEIQLLGNFGVIVDHRYYTPTAHKTRQLFALLAVRLNQIVGFDCILTELWGDTPPRSAAATTHTYIHKLRRMLAHIDLDEPVGNIVATTPRGYMFQADVEQTDVARFNRLLDDGRTFLERGRAREAASALRDAVDMSFEPVLCNVTQGPLLRQFVTHIEEQRILVFELHVNAEMRLGRYRELVPELKSLVSAHPFNEWFHAQLIICLSKSGRRDDALRAYHELRHQLNAKLGLDPSRELQRIQREVLISASS